MQIQALPYTLIHIIYKNIHYIYVEHVSKLREEEKKTRMIE
jgi:hypothetical protein